MIGSCQTPTVDGEKGYLLDNRQVEAGRRFAALSELFDAVTFAHMARLGVGDGWRCWEAGAGGASVAGWLAARVGDAGDVLATDIDLSWVPGDAPFRTAVHELGRDPLPASDFDLVHARLLLVHVTDRERGLADLVRAVRPGGWLLLEEADTALQPLVCPDEVGEAEELANRLKSGFRRLMAGRGVDLALGRRLPRLLRTAGLVDVGADAYFPLSSPATAVLEVATVEQIRERLLQAGLASAGEIEQHLENVRAGRLDVATPPLVSSWGRKPAA